MSVNKVIVNGVTKLDLTNDTVSENTLLENATAHDAAGNAIKGAVVVAPIDTELSSESENPVQNKAIAKELKKKIDKDLIDSELSEESENPVQNKAIAAELKKKIDKNSVDSELSEDSENPLQNKVIAGKIDELEKKIGISDVGNIITGSYTGNGLEFSDAITLYGTDTPVFPISPVETTNNTVINIGVTPKVVIIGSSTNLEESINNNTQYIITRDMPYRSTSPSSYKDLTTQKNSYVIQINGNPFNKTMTFQQSADSNQKIKYHFWAEQARLEVVSDDIEPTETQIRKSDLQEELLLNELYNSSAGITGIEIKSVDDVVVGQYVIKAVCNQVVSYSFRTTTKIVEGGFAVSKGYGSGSGTNGADLTYGFVALC